MLRQIRPSVCPSVTLRYCVKTRERRGMRLSPPGSPVSLVYWYQEWLMRDDPVQVKFECKEFDRCEGCACYVAHTERCAVGVSRLTCFVRVRRLQNHLTYLLTYLLNDDGERYAARLGRLNYSFSERARHLIGFYCYSFDLFKWRRGVFSAICEDDACRVYATSMTSVCPSVTLV